MRVGILSQDEAYLSLSAVTDAAAAVLANSYEIIRYHWHRDEKYSSADVQDVFRASDVVVSLGSRAPRAERGCDTPGMFLAHAWMDHAAGLNLHALARNFRQADIFTFACRAALRKYRRVYPQGPRGVILPYFVPGLGAMPRGQEADRSAGPASRHALASRLGLPPELTWVLYAGRLDEEKNTLALVRMWSRLARKDAILVLAGTLTGIQTAGFEPRPQPPAALAECLSKIGAGEYSAIRWLGSLCRADVTAMLGHSRVLVNPTLCYEEDFGLVAAEAMAAGVPVVCSDWGGLRDIVVHGKTGYRARTYLLGGRAWLDEDEYCRHLSRVLDDVRLRERLATAAHDRALREYAEHVFTRRIGSLLEQLAAFRGAAKDPARLDPAPWIHPAFQHALETNLAWPIYSEMIVFNRLYRDYASMQR